MRIYQAATLNSLRERTDGRLRGPVRARPGATVRDSPLAFDFTSRALGSRNEPYDRLDVAPGPRNMQMAQLRADRTDGARVLGRLLEADTTDAVSAADVASL